MTWRSLRIEEGRFIPSALLQPELGNVASSIAPPEPSSRPVPVPYQEIQSSA
jgi:hypothetical protein